MIKLRNFRRSGRGATFAFAGATAGVMLGASIGGAIASTNAGEPDASASGTKVAQSKPSAAPSFDPGEPLEAPGAAKLKTGRVKVNPDVARLQTPVASGSKRSADGAVAAFTSYSTWLIASPAAHDEPQLAVDEVGGSLLNRADAQLLVNMKRGKNDNFAAEKGAYRVLGYSGSPDSPDQVMVEVAAPLTIAGSPRWSVVGGVVKWVDGSWQLFSIQPREIKQPTSGTSAESFTAAERSTVLDGLGWQLFNTER